MDDGLYSVCELTYKQKRAFNRLKRAYKACKDAGIFFANNYGNLMAFDSKLVAGYGDDAISPGCESVLIAFGKDNANILKQCNIQGKYLILND